MWFPADVAVRPEDPELNAIDTTCPSPLYQSTRVAALASLQVLPTHAHERACMLDTDTRWLNVRGIIDPLSFLSSFLCFEFVLIRIVAARD